MAESIQTVKLLATLRTVAGVKELAVPLPAGATARDLLQAVREANPALGAFILEDDGQLKPGIQVIVSGRHIEWLQGLDTPVSDAKSLLLVPPISGG